MLGPDNAVPGYWGPVEADPAPFYATICRLAGTFFDAYLKEDSSARDELRRDGESKIQAAGHEIGLEFRAGPPAPPAGAEWIHRIIRDGADSIRPDLDRALADAPGRVSIDEAELNWLGYHFLYWWGREAEAVTVFQLAVRLYPDSANAHDSLAEAYLVNGRRLEAIASYRTSLELNPQNTNASSQLERLGFTEHTRDK
jgi:tetratricopeptide (TPR) repeat protein